MPCCRLRSEWRLPCRGCHTFCFPMPASARLAPTKTPCRSEFYRHCKTTAFLGAALKEGERRRAAERTHLSVLAAFAIAPVRTAMLAVLAIRTTIRAELAAFAVTPMRTAIWAVFAVAPSGRRYSLYSP
jgi:hypothetical protein